MSTSQWVNEIAYDTLKEGQPELINTIRLLLLSGQTKRQIVNAVKPTLTPFIAGLMEGAIDHMQAK